MQLPERKVADGFTGRVFHRTLHGIDQAPISADGTLELTLPRLVIGFDQIDAKILLLRQTQDFGHDPRLIGARRQRTLAHSSLARPAGFPDQNFLARKRHRHSLADGVDMGGGMFRTDREVFPVGQDVDRDKIDGFIDFPVAKPIFPHIGVGDRNRNLRFDRADGGGEVGCRHLTAQQHLVADHHRGDDIRVFLRQAHHGRNLRQVLQAVAAEPYSLDDL